MIYRPLHAAGVGALGAWSSQVLARAAVKNVSKHTINPMKNPRR